MPAATHAHPAGHPPLQPHRVAIGRSVDWLAYGWGNFLRNPGVWIAQGLILIVVLFVAGLIPLFGWAIVLVGFPVLIGGLLSGVDALESNRPLTVNLLFDGLRRHGGNLVMVGVFYLLGGLAAGLLSLLVGSSGLSGFLAGPMAGTGLTMGSVLIASVVFTLLWLLLIMALSFAPALVLLGDCAPLDAMRLSIQACFRNLPAFLTMAVILYVLTWVAMLPAGLGMLVLLPVLAGSLYAAYRDIFAPGAPALPPVQDL